jgi:ribosomal protein L17
MSLGVCESGGCTFNAKLELQTYRDNKVTRGVSRARQISHTSIFSYRSERAGKAVTWSVELTDDGEDVMLEDGTLLLTVVTKNPFTCSRAHLVDDTIRETAVVEGATIRNAIHEAKKGASLIVFPEQHITEEGFVVRYFTVWKQDTHNSRLYHGSRVDLGKNVSLHDAPTVLRERAPEYNSLHFNNDQQEQHAYVFSNHPHLLSRASPVDAIIDESVASTRRVSDTRKTIDDVITYVKNNHSKKELHEVNTIEQKKVQRRLKDLVIGNFGKDIIIALTEKPRFQEHEKRTLSEIWKDTAKAVLHISEKEADDLHDAVIMMHEKMQKTKETIAMSVETGVGIHGALVLMESMVNLDMSDKTILPKMSVQEVVEQSIIQKNEVSIIQVFTIKQFIEETIQRNSEHQSSSIEDNNR